MAELPAGSVQILRRIRFARGRVIVIGRANGVTTAGGHVSRAMLGVSRIEVAFGGQSLGLIAHSQMHPNTQSSTDNEAFPGDLWILTSGTTDVPFLVIGRT